MFGFSDLELMGAAVALVLGGWLVFGREGASTGKMLFLMTTGFAVAAVTFKDLLGG